MTDLILSIGDKNLSSWSLRPWLLMKHAGIAFTEENIKLDVPGYRKELAEKAPSGTVPFLVHRAGGQEIKLWDSLAICEYLNDLFPEKKLWPSDIHARAFARAISAEMHSSFSALRTMWPMMFTRNDNFGHTTQGGVARDIARINQIWTDARTRFGLEGDFLFGDFSIADAMYAPVVSRFGAYGPVDLSTEAAAYMETIRTLSAMKEWGEGALAELEGA